MEPRSLLLVSFFSCTFGDAQLPSLHRLLTASLFWWHCHFLLITIACKTLTCCCVYVNPLVPLRCIIICIVTKVPCTLQKGWCELLESAAPLPVKAVPTKPRNIIVRCAYQKASWSPIFHRFLILHLDVCKRTKLHKQIQKKKKLIANGSCPHFPFACLQHAWSVCFTDVCLNCCSHSRWHCSESAEPPKLNQSA